MDQEFFEKEDPKEDEYDVPGKPIYEVVIVHGEQEARKLVAKLQANPFAELLKFKPCETSTRGDAFWVGALLSGHLKSKALSFHAEGIRNIETKPGCWSELEIGVFEGDKQVGVFKRNYPSHVPFAPFVWKGKTYALYSKDYICTRIMTLPDCQDVGGEEPKPNGFCPVELYVPVNPLTGESSGFGFVAGCVWGDDSSWKIQYLDLSRVEEGIITRDDRLGYIHLPSKMSLVEAVEPTSFDLRLGSWYNIRITVDKYYSAQGKVYDDSRD